MNAPHYCCEKRQRSMASMSNFADIKKTYPDFSKPKNSEEQAFFDWVAKMGFDGIIAIDGVNNDKSKASNKRGK